jgi:hypothetical protein
MMANMLGRRNRLLGKTLAHGKAWRCSRKGEGAVHDAEEIKQMIYESAKKIM